MKRIPFKPGHYGLFLAASLLLPGFLFTSCDRSRNDKGYEYFPDMAHSLAYETYSPNPNFPDGKTDQAPVAGTISREMIPYPYDNTAEGRLRAGQELRNPLENTADNLLKGKETYAIFCQTCHGEKGLGDGYLYTSKRFPVPPANFTSARVMGLPDGEIFHVITRGYNAMGPHGAQIQPDDRWRILMYMKQELQQKTNP